MGKKKILIIAPFFAPQSHSGMYRVHKLTKYLPDFGWDPYVITTDTNYLFNEDQSLMDDLKRAKIYRARYIEPSVRGLKMALGGVDRRFVALKKSANDFKGDGLNEQKSSLSLGQGFYRFMQNHWLNSPDTYWTWRGPAISLAEKLIREEGINLVFTTAMPYTSNVIGMHLKEKLGLKWVADFRDPSTYPTKFHSPVDSVFLKQRKIDSVAWMNADARSVTSTSYISILNDIYCRKVKMDASFIPTGVDESLVPQSVDQEGRNQKVVFVGEFTPEYGDDFFKVFSHMIKQNRLTNMSVKVEIIGQIGLNKARIVPLIKSLNIESYFEFIDQIPQKELYQKISNSLATLLVPGSKSYWPILFAKMIDYIALGRPVIALVPDPSEARTRLHRAGLGVFIDGEVEEASIKLASFLNGTLPPLTVNKVEQAMYFSSKMVGSFVKIFDKLNKD